jgi:hypothetical protein
MRGKGPTGTPWGVTLRRRREVREALMKLQDILVLKRITTFVCVSLALAVAMAISGSAMAAGSGS